MKNKLIILLVVFAFQLQAQEAKTLLLKDAINYALQNKVEAKKAALDVENAEYKIQEFYN